MNTKGTPMNPKDVLTRNEIIELRARAVAQNEYPWEMFIKEAKATIEADEKAGVLMLVEKECAIVHPANTAWSRIHAIKNIVMFSAWDSRKDEIVRLQQLDTTFEIGWREAMRACKEAMLGGELRANTPVYQCKKEPEHE